MLLKIHPDNPSQRQISRLVEILKKGGVIIYPTDTVYGLGCDIFNQKAVERVAKIKGVKIQKANFSFIFYDLSHLSDYAHHVSNSIFKLMKYYLPGPYTFILEANNKIPKIFRTRKKTIGIRIPDNNIVRNIVKDHHGKVWASSQGMGRGSVFSVRLPRARKYWKPAVSRSAQSEQESSVLK